MAKEPRCKVAVCRFRGREVEGAWLARMPGKRRIQDTTYGFHLTIKTSLFERLAGFYVRGVNGFTPLKVNVSFNYSSSQMGDVFYRFHYQVTHLDNNGKSALYHACARGHLDCARFLLSHCDWRTAGSSIDQSAACLQGLVAAVRGAHLGVIEYVLDFEEEGAQVVGRCYENWCYAK